MQLYEHAKKDIGPEMPGPLEVVVADKLESKVTMWPKFSTSIRDFEAINKAARWNYQRDRIYIGCSPLII